MKGTYQVKRLGINPDVSAVAVKVTSRQDDIESEPGQMVQPVQSAGEVVKNAQDV